MMSILTMHYCLAPYYPLQKSHCPRSSTPYVHLPRLATCILNFHSYRETRSYAGRKT